jgi:putative NADPH-quinone reductase
VKVLVVSAHPVPDSFLAAARTRALAGLHSAGHEVRHLDLYERDFDPRLSLERWRGHLDPPHSKPDIAEDVAALREATALVLIYPAWYSTQPAMLKGWFDRVLTSGVAFSLSPGQQGISSELRHLRRLAVVTTHGASKWVNSVQGEPGKRTLRGLRVMAHPLCRTRWVAFYGTDHSDAERRSRWLGRVERSMMRL